MTDKEADRLIDEALKRINKRLDVVIARQDREPHKPETQGERIENLKKQIIAKLDKLPRRPTDRELSKPEEENHVSR